MQLCALDSHDALVFAEKAVKQTNYHCLECRQTVRVRSGIHRQPHYYHLQPNANCRSHAKGMPHLMMQYFLKNLLPTGEVDIEVRFPEIGRIADVVWHTKQLVYEIQCSPISADEVAARNAGYASIGYQVVWILHDDRYNKYQLSAAEDVLKDAPHYFTNMDSRGEGDVYDQFAIIDQGKRRHRLPRLPIDLSSPRFKDEHSGDHQLPQLLQRRALAWALGFNGDTLERVHHDEELNAKIRSLPGHEHLRAFARFFASGRKHFNNMIVRPYSILLRLFLERSCK